MLALWCLRDRASNFPEKRLDIEQERKRKGMVGMVGMVIFLVFIRLDFGKEANFNVGNVLRVD